MAWLARLTNRSRRWPAPVRWLYFALIAYLVATGAIVIIASAASEFSTHRVGLGIGIALAALFALAGLISRPSDASSSK